MAGQVKGVSTSSLPNTSIRSVGKGSSNGKQTAPGPASSGDKVSISSQLGNVDHILSQVPIVDGARVEQIREDIADGNYEINPYRIATKFIQIEFNPGYAGASYGSR